MILRDWLFDILFIFWFLKGMDFILGMLFLIPTPKPSKAAQSINPSQAPLISVLIAARNEEKSIRQCVLSILNQDYPNLEVIVADDRSDDKTSAILQELSRTHSSRLQVQRVNQLPEGWLGKTHGQHQAYQASHGQYLLFTDADVIFKKEAITSAIQLLQKHNRDHVTLLPALDNHGYLESAFTDYFAFVFNLRYRPWMARFSWTRNYCGIGAFNLLSRASYEASGTHQAIALDVADDMMLGKIIKRNKFKSMLANGNKLISVRWVEGFGGILSSLHKNAFRGLDYSFAMLGGATLVLLFFDILPWIGLWFFKDAEQMMCAIVLIIIYATYLALGRYSPKTATTYCAHPFASALMIVMMWRSALSAARDGVVWRDTVYSLDELRKKGRTR